jgi:uncharacterized protein (TIGR00288 family)
MPEREHTLAVFIDFENLALGFEGRRGTRFEIQKVLERLVEKGKIIVKRAYADWGRFRDYRTSLHEAAIELIEIPRRSMTGKNSADIRLVVDAMDLSYSKEHVHTFVIISGDSDFSPLVSKLKENGKHVIGLGMKNSTSDLLIDNCDEFIFYEDLDRPTSAPQSTELANIPPDKRKVFSLLMDAFVALRRENKEVIWSSMVKDTIKRKKPQFNETYYGFRTFSNLLEEGERYGLISLTTDPRSGTYVVSEAGSRPQLEATAGSAANGGPDRPRNESRGPSGEAGRDAGREDRWGRRRNRYGRSRWEDRREGAYAEGYQGEPRAGSEGQNENDPSGVTASEDANASQDSMHHDQSSIDFGSHGEGQPARESNDSSDRGDNGGSGRDDYGFPSYDAPAAETELPEARDEAIEVAAPVKSGEDDDRTPEERDLDARAAAMAHSLEAPVSPSGARKTGPRGPRTPASAGRPRRTPGGRVSGTAEKSPAAASRRGPGRPRPAAPAAPAAPTSAPRGRRPAGASAPRRRRKSE